MKSLIEFYGRLSTEIESLCCTNAHLDVGTYTNRDLKTIKARVEHEGLSFLTITLPTFGKDFERCLEEGRITDDAFPGFGRRAGLPKFLGWALRLVFDSATGVLLPDVSIEALAGVRQLTLAFAKMQVDCTTDRVADAFTRYLEVENDVKLAMGQGSCLSVGASDSIHRASRVLFGDVLGLVERDLNSFRLIPKHGPGATAERVSGNRKFTQSAWPRRLDEFFPKEDYIIPSPRFYNELDGVDIVEPEAELPVRVISVPKTLKTPRIIAIEPVSMQYAQQALAENLVGHISHDNRICDLIGFVDQDVNRVLAQKGSLFGHLATLDLSDASDRVSIEHVRSLLSDYPDLLGAVMAARSTHARVPDREGGHLTIELSKFASMGSALTFPIEAMIFLCASFIGIAKARNTKVTAQLVKSMQGQVRVYGDDIIVPVDCVLSVIETLESLGFKVNSSKSFWTGKFRESCGGDYFNGHDVSIVRVRKFISFSQRNEEEFESTVSLRNQLYKAGYWATAAWMDRKFRESRSHYPTVHESSSAIGRHTFLEYETHRMCPNLHRPLVKAWVRKDPIPESPLDGYGALLKFFLKRGEDPYDERHLTHSGRPKSSSMKLRSVTPY